MSRTFSPQQEAVFAFFAAGAGHGVVEALAGSGKTTTIVEAVNRISPEKKVLVCAFNKSIQTEVKGRLRAGVDCKTLHSLGYAALRKAWGYVAPNDRKDLEFVRKVLPEDAESDVVQDIRKLASLAMNTLTTDARDIEDLMYDFDLGPTEVSPEIYVSWTLKVLELALQKGPEICFDQMIFVPAKNGWRTGSYDFVIVDETQDMNVAQLTLAKNALKRAGRFVAVGDPHQAIYGFRGAASGSMRTIVETMRARVLPLSVTYRCGRAVAEYAARLVPTLTAWDGADDGVVERATEVQFLREVRPGDFVLSRKNAPLAGYCLRLLAEGRRAYIQGKDLGVGLQAFIRKSKCATIPDFLAWLGRYKRTEIERLQAADRDDQVDALIDKVEVLTTLSEGLVTTFELIDRIGGLFDAAGNGGGRIMFSSVHKAKGLEADRVWCLNNTFNPGKSQEEDNLCYVAWTRAKQTLVLVDAPTKKTA